MWVQKSKDLGVMVINLDRYDEVDILEQPGGQAAVVARSGTQSEFLFRGDPAQCEQVIGRIVAALHHGHGAYSLQSEGY